MGEKPKFGEAEIGESSKDKRYIEIPSNSNRKDIISTIANQKHLSLKELEVTYREIREAQKVRIKNELEISNTKFYWILQGFR